MATGKIPGIGLATKILKIQRRQQWHCVEYIKLRPKRPKGTPSYRHLHIITNSASRAMSAAENGSSPNSRGKLQETEYDVIELDIKTNWE